MEKLRAYRLFEMEMKELIKFLNSTKYAFNKVGSLINFAKNKDHKKYFENNGFDTKPSGICRFKRNSVLILEKTLNQQTLVRAISALEIFLVDLFRDVFIITKIPFKDQSKIHEYSQSQILSIKSTSELFNQIINKECRSLSSGGFNEIIKAYKKRLDIDLLHISPGKQKMIEYHEIRHLIVHKLGRTDSQFRERYKLNNKAGISVDDEYLIICIKDIEGFAEKTHELVAKRICELTTPNLKEHSYERQIKYNIEILNLHSNLDFLNTDFEFWVNNDELEILKNILIDKKTLNENEFEITLAGTKRQIRAYYSHLKYAKNKRNINLTIIEDSLVQNSTNEVDEKKKRKIIEDNGFKNSTNESNKQGKRKFIYIEENILELIREQLPEQPWETGIHKKVAKKLGLEDRIVRSAITILISKGFFKYQIAGVLVENRKNEA